MPVYAGQTAFNGGEIAPELYQRTDLQKYASALRKCRNFIVKPQGGAYSRSGTKFIAETKDSTKKSRLVKFQFNYSRSQSYILEFGHQYIRFYLEGGQILDSDVPVEIVSPYDQEDIFDLNFNQSADVLYITHPDYPTQELTRNSNVDWEINEFEFKNGPFNPDRRSLNYGVNLSVSGTTGSVTITAPPLTHVFLSTMVGALMSFPQDIEAQKVSHTFNTTTPSAISITGATKANPVVVTAPSHGFSNGQSVDITDVNGMTQLNGNRYKVANKTTNDFQLKSIYDGSNINGTGFSTYTSAGHVILSPGSTVNPIGSSSSIMCKGVWRMITHGTWTGSLSIEKSIDNGSTWIEIRSFTSKNDQNFNEFDNEDEFCLIRVTCYDYVSGTIHVDLTSDAFSHTGIVKITSYTGDRQVSADVKVTIADASVNMTTWYVGSWCELFGYPTVSWFFQDRLFFAGTKGEPQTIWGSKTGDYNDFGTSSTLVDSDAVAVSINSRQINPIQNVAVLGAVIIFTGGSVFAIGAAQGDVLSPTNIQAREQEEHGISDIPPVKIGNRAIYIDPMGKAVRDMGYDYNSQGYIGAEINLFANHLFKSHSFVDIDYQKEPEKNTWFVRDDGILLCLAYSQEQQLLAWTTHDTNGLVESVCCIPGDGHHELWMIVNRNGNRYVEVLQTSDPYETDPKTKWYVDSGIQYNDPKVITGATKANPVVVTVAAHGYSNGDLVDLSDVEGMTELNGKRFKIANKTTNTFELTDVDSGDDIDGTAYGTYTGGGYSRLATTEISGLDHLEGYDVSVLADGSVVYGLTVESGQITLPTPASIVTIGLGYNCDIETLNVELNIPDGSIRSRRIKISDVSLYLINSRGGKIGPNENSLNDELLYPIQNYDDPKSLFSGHIQAEMNSEYDFDGHIFIRQSDPLPMNIISITPQVTLGG